MEIPLFFEYYFIWHYGRAIKEIYGIGRNFLWFLWHFFSIEVIAKTFFSPWRRMNEQYMRGFNLEAVLSSFIVNSLMRIVGVIIRAITLLIALFGLLTAILLFFVFLFLWLILPFIVVLLVYQGIHELL